MTFQRQLVRVGQPAWWGIRRYWGTSISISIAAAVTVIVLLPVAGMVLPGSLVEPRLSLAKMSAGGLSVMWGSDAHGPADIQQAAVAHLFQIVVFGLGAVVAVAAVTLVSLFLARSSQRTREMAARRAVGASRGLLLSSALLEVALMAGAALVVGVGVASVVTPWIMTAWPGQVLAGERWPAIASLAGFIALIVVCALLPVVFARSNRISDDPGKPVPRLLPAFQLGLSLIVLSVAGLLTRQVSTRLEGSGGVAARGEVFRQTMDDAAPSVRAGQYADLLDALNAGARYDSVSLTSTGSILGLGTVAAVTTDCGQCTEGGIYLPWHVVTATHQFVSADSFHALGVRLLAGRGITNEDRWGTTPVAVVNRSLALRHFERGEAIGRKIILGDDARTWHVVVGIVDDPPARGLGGSLLPVYTVYASVLQHPVPDVELLIRPLPSMTVDAAAVATVRRALAPDHTSRLTEQRLLADELRPLGWFATLIQAEGWAVLVLACGGTFVLIRLWVDSLLTELGIRRAVGARRRHIIALVLLRAAGMALGGVAAGLWFGPGLWNVVHGVMADLPAWNADVVARYAAILVAAVVLGAAPPAWRAARTTPGELITC
jgi:putative ABC transport system permease protein